jgi:hypothetical protein
MINPSMCLDMHINKRPGVIRADNPRWVGSLVVDGAELLLEKKIKKIKNQNWIAKLSMYSIPLIMPC